MLHVLIYIRKKKLKCYDIHVHVTFEKSLQIGARVMHIYSTTIKLLLILLHLLHLIVGEFYQCTLNNECVTLFFFHR